MPFPVQSVPANPMMTRLLRSLHHRDYFPTKKVIHAQTHVLRGGKNVANGRGDVERVRPVLLQGEGARWPRNLLLFNKGYGALLKACTNSSEMIKVGFVGSPGVQAGAS